MSWMYQPDRLSKPAQPYQPLTSDGLLVEDPEDWANEQEEVR